jgi:hypothetical protein
MWQLIPWRKQVYIITALAIVLAWSLDTALEWIQGEHAPVVKFISFFTIVITVVVAGAASATWRYLWQRFPALARKTFPDLNGTWNGTLLSTWIDPATGKRVAPISANLLIRQGLFSMSIRLRTDESTSHSTRYVLEAYPDAGRFRVWYSYDNRPKAESAFRSARHEGVGWLEMDINSDPKRLDGQYYTDRRTTGDMSFSRVSRKMKAAT